MSLLFTGKRYLSTLVGFISIMILTSFSALLAQTKVILSDEKSNYPLVQQLEILEDQDRKLSLRDILNGEADSLFTKPKENQLLQGTVASTYWLRLELQAGHSKDKRLWYLQLGNPHINIVDVTFLSDGKKVKSYHTGDQYPYAQRPFRHHLFVFPFEIQANKELNVVIKVELDGRGWLPISILSHNSLLRKSSQKNAALGLLFGILLAALFFTVYGFFMSPEKATIWMLFYLLGIIFYILGFEKLDFALFHPEWPLQRSTQLPCLIALFSICLFCRDFFRVNHKRTPWLNRFLYLILGFITLTAALTMILPTVKQGLIFVTFSAIFASCIVLVIAIAYWQRGEKQAKFFFISWSWLLLAIIIFSAQVLDILPQNEFTNRTVFVGISLQVCTLALYPFYKLYVARIELKRMLRRTINHSRYILKINRTMGKFVPNEFLAVLGRKDITEVQLGDHVECTMTILFSDIRSFTYLSEGMSLEENFRFITNHFQKMEAIVRENHGFVDKFIGDAVMALYPKSADDALRSGIMMQKSIDKQNKHHSESGNPPIRIGISLNTGVLTLGVLGGEGRMENTVISDAVNIASHLESFNKIYSTKMILTQETVDNLTRPQDFLMRKLDRIQVGGKKKSINIYEVLEADEDHIYEAKKKTLKHFREGQNYYEQKKYTEAIPFLKHCIEQFSGDRTASILLSKCEKNQRNQK